MFSTVQHEEKKYPSQRCNSTKNKTIWENMELLNRSSDYMAFNLSIAVVAVVVVVLCAFLLSFSFIMFSNENEPHVNVL